MIKRCFQLPFQIYHARQAAHLRALAENATTSRLKNRLLNEARRHEVLAAIEDEQP